MQSNTPIGGAGGGKGAFPQNGQHLEPAGGMVFIQCRQVQVVGNAHPTCRQDACTTMNWRATLTLRAFDLQNHVRAVQVDLAGVRVTAGKCRFRERVRERFGADVIAERSHRG